MDCTNNQLAKDYLSQALYIDQRIDAKFQQLQNARDLTTRATASLTGMPKSPSPARPADFIVKAMDLEQEIYADLQYLIELKQEICGVIRQVPDPDCQTLLELRYLGFKSWDLIAIDMYFDRRSAHRVHGRALAEVGAILRSRK